MTTNRWKLLFLISLIVISIVLALIFFNPQVTKLRLFNQFNIFREKERYEPGVNSLEKYLSYDNNPTIREILAKFHEENGYYHEASIQYEILINTDPDNAYYVYSYAKMMLLTDKYDIAKTYLKKALELDPDNPLIANLINYIENLKIDINVSNHNNTHVDRPEENASLQEITQYAKRKLSEGSLQEALIYIAKACLMESSSITTELLQEVYILQAQYAYENKNPILAISKAEMALSLGDSFEASLLLFDSYLYRGQHSEAISLLDALDKIYEDSSELILRHAKMFEFSGEFEIADEYYLRAISMDPTNASTALAYVSFLSSLSRDSEIVEFLESFEKLDSSPELLSIYNTSLKEMTPYTFIDSAFGELIAKALNISLEEITVGMLSKIQQIEIVGNHAAVNTGHDAIVSMFSTGGSFKDLEGNWITKRGKIRCLDDLMYFPNLEFLSINLHKIDKLPDFYGLDKLRWITLIDNYIEDIEPLSNVTNLSRLYLSKNKISDISPLANCKYLTIVGFAYNSVSDLKPLSEFTNIRSIDFSENNISDLEPLKNLYLVDTLLLQGNYIDNIQPIEQLHELKFLNLSQNSINDISPLSNMDKLWSVMLSGNDITDISALSDCESLTSLSLHTNRISDLSPLASCKSITSLGLNLNNINDVSPLSGLINLEYLLISGNNISDASPLLTLTNLTYLNIVENPLNDNGEILNEMTWVNDLRK